MGGKEEWVLCGSDVLAVVSKVRISRGLREIVGTKAKERTGGRKLSSYIRQLHCKDNLKPGYLFLSWEAYKDLHVRWGKRCENSPGYFAG